MNRIKELREQMGVTQTQLGQVLNVSKSTISKYENGSLDLNSTTIAILCDYFQVSANQLLGISAIDNISPINAAPNTAEPLDTDPTLQAIIRLAANLTPAQRQKALKLLELFSDESSDAPSPL